MPPLATAFGRNADNAAALATAVEIARLNSSAGSTAHKALTPLRLTLVYELAYLRAFTEWEAFIEESLIRFLCGYHTPAYNPTFAPGKACLPSLVAAKTALFGPQPYMLWYKPNTIVVRVTSWITGCPIETVMVTAQQHLEWAAAIRHRIAHRSADAKLKFDNASMSLTGQRYAASSAGRLLRSYAPSGRRWLHELTDSLKGLAAQIAP